jgi:hypothetical protein
MQQRPRVFLDTSVVKHSIRKKTVLRPNPPKQVRFGNTTHEAIVHSVITYDPTDKVGEPLRTEIDRLSDIAAFAKAGDIELLWQAESHVEFLGTYSVPGGGQSELLEAGVTMVEGPIAYGRVLSPTRPGETWGSLQADFLKSLHQRRFRELQKACGALQGRQIHERQLLDAFHIWCAEEAKATHFLTTDLKLVRTVRACKTSPPLVRVITPSKLVTEIASSLGGTP